MIEGGFTQRSGVRPWKETGGLERPKEGKGIILHTQRGKERGKEENIRSLRDTPVGRNGGKN